MCLAHTNRVELIGESKLAQVIKDGRNKNESHVSHEMNSHVIGRFNSRQWLNEIMRNVV